MAGEREPLVLPSKRAAEFADELHALARHAALARDESEDMGDDLAAEVLTGALALVERRLDRIANFLCVHVTLAEARATTRARADAA